jgi:hypothetical protein
MNPRMVGSLGITPTTKRTVKRHFWSAYGAIEAAVRRRPN